MTDSIKQRHIAEALSKKTESLKVDAAVPAAPPKVRSRNLDVSELWNEEKARRKPSAAFVVIGHVDHGKSTLMGRLLLDIGAVAQRDIDKYQKQATELGKSSFALAWVMDTSVEERERGVTFDFAQHHFNTDTTDFTILDAPGHRDFVPNMIGGASMADVAVLVVDANQLDSGLKGQTKEHVLLAKAAGLARVIVAVNKLDSTTPAWSSQAFQTVRSQVSRLLKEVGFLDQNVCFVCCSGLSGEGVVREVSATWATGQPTLLHALEQSVPPGPDDESIKRPFRMQIIDVFRGSITNPLSVSGRITAGNVQVSDPILIQPSGETATVRAIEVADESKDYAVAKQICTLHLQDIDPQYLRTGDVICSTSHAVAVAKTFTALVDVLDPLLPQPIDLHVGRLHVPATISQLDETIGTDGKQLKRKPRVLKPGQKARVKISLQDGIPLDEGERIVLRSAGVTAAYGKVDKF